MNTLNFIYNEIPNSRGNIDKCIKITPNEICCLLLKYYRCKANWYGKRIELTTNHKEITDEMFYQLREELEIVEKKLGISIVLSDIHIMPK